MGTKLYSTAPVLVVALLLLAPSARAVTFDFAAVAAGGPVTWDAVTGVGEGGYSSFSMTVGGLTVTATAFIPSPEPPPAPFGPPGPTGVEPLLPDLQAAEVYLDVGAGMGVCKPDAIIGGGADQCAYSTDDELGPGEILMLQFSSAVTLGGIAFRNETHGTSFWGQFALSTDGGASTPRPLSHAFTPALARTGTLFSFGHINENYYIESIDVRPVSEPATFGLLGAALLLAGLRARSRRG